MKAIAVALRVLKTFTLGGLIIFCMTIQVQAISPVKGFVNIPVTSAGALFMVSFPEKIERILEIEPYSDDIVVHQHPTRITIQVLPKLKESTRLTVQTERAAYDVILTPTISSNK